MKKLILTGLTLLIAMSMTFAQDSTPEEKAKVTVEKLTEKLTLTSEQQTSIYKIILELKQAKGALDVDSTSSAVDVQKQKESLKATADSKIAEQLSDEQKSLFTKFVEERDSK